MFFRWQGLSGSPTRNQLFPLWGSHIVWICSRYMYKMGQAFFERRTGYQLQLLVASVVRWSDSHLLKVWASMNKTCCLDPFIYLQKIPWLRTWWIAFNSEYFILFRVLVHTIFNSGLLWWMHGIMAFPPNSSPVDLHFLTALKTLDTIGNCQRLTFTVGVSRHMHKITNLWKLELNRPMNLIIMKEKTPLSYEVVCV